MPQDVQVTQECELWAENEPVVMLFSALMTQLRCGPGGLIGLDYAVIPVTARLLSMPLAQQRECFTPLRVMEGELLRWAREREG